jgi:probable phosphoglycerate mutase
MNMRFPRRRRIYLMRHGEVEYFGDGGKPFQPDAVPLTEHGRRQAEAAGATLADVAIDKAVVSPLLRTQQTAELVLRGRSVPIETADSLREIAPGKLRDLPDSPEAIFRTFVDAFGSSLRPEDQFLGGETFGSLLGRVHPAIDAIMAEPTWNNLLIVAHGGVNRVLLCRALGTELAGFGRLEQDPACVNIIDVDDEGRLLVRLINFTPLNIAKTGHRLTTMEYLLTRYMGVNPDDHEAPA